MNHSDALMQTVSDYQACLGSLEADLKASMAKSKDPRIQSGLRELLELLVRKRASIEPNSLLELDGLQARIDSGLRRYADLQSRQELITQRLVALINPAGTGQS
jgi:hypothetical protein